MVDVVSAFRAYCPMTLLCSGAARVRPVRGRRRCRRGSLRILAGVLEATTGHTLEGVIGIIEGAGKLAVLGGFSEVPPVIVAAVVVSVAPRLDSVGALLRPRQQAVREVHHVEPRGEDCLAQVELGAARARHRCALAHGVDRSRCAGGHLDTGVAGQHPALAGRIAAFLETDEEGRAVPSATPRDTASHGTHTAGILCGGVLDGEAIGVAPDAVLHSAAVIDGGRNVVRVLRGLDWLRGSGVRVLSMALGIAGRTPSSGRCSRRCVPSACSPCAPSATTAPPDPRARHLPRGAHRGRRQ